MTASVLAHLAEHYADRLALDWRRRGALLRSPLADFPALHAWDERLEGAMDALRLLGPAARQHMRRCLDQPLNAGEVFALLSHALRNDLADLAEGAVAIACSVPRLQPALVAALAWGEPAPLWHRIAARLPLALRFDVAASRHADAPGLLACALAALDAPGRGPASLAAAWRCLRQRGERGRAPRLIEQAIHHLDDRDELLRRQAAHAVLVLAPGAYQALAVEALLDIVHSAGAQCEPAARCLAVYQPDRLLKLMGDPGSSPPERTRLHLQAMGWAGDIAVVPRLIEHLDAPAHARLAAASLRLLTGLCPVRDDWQGEPLHAASAGHADADSPDIPADDPDAGLPWPSRAAFAALWSSVRGRHGGPQSRLGGQPTSADHLWTVLRDGPLAWRPLAAAHLQRLRLGALFPVRQPARRQLALLTP